MLQIRPMNTDDIPAVVRIAAECYPPDLYEDEATMRARLQLAPDTAWVAEDDDGAGAYLFAYRSALGKVTPLNGLFETTAAGDTLYLHDLAVSSRCRGRGAGLALVHRALQEAAEAGFTRSALVSVQGSEPFWAKLGYTPWDGLDPAQLANLRTYPEQSLYMAKRLP